MDRVGSTAPPPASAPVLASVLAPVESPAERVGAVVGVLWGVDGSGWLDGERLAVVSALEELKAACAAVQARVTVALVESHRAAHDPDACRVPGAASGSGSGAGVLGGESGGSDGDGLGVGVSPSRRRAGRGVGEMVALARRESPSRGDQHVGLARALVGEMPLLHGLLTRGLVSEWVATRVVQGTATLSRVDRAAADARLAPVLPGLGARGAGAAARRVAAELDAASVVAQMVAAVRSRRVTVRAAPDGMAYLTVLAPLVEAVGAFAALGRDADAVLGGHGGQPVQGRCRGQLMSDLAVQRMGGLGFGQVQPVEIQLVMTDTALFGHTSTSATPATDTDNEGTDEHERDDEHEREGDSDDEHEHEHEGGGGGGCSGVGGVGRGRRGSSSAPVEVVGFGPVPAAFIRDRLRHGTSANPNLGRRRGFECANGHWVDPVPSPTDIDPGADQAAATDPARGVADVWLRRLYLSPDGRDLVAMDSRRRVFGGLLRQFLVLRDQSCRVPWCEAPIRAVDHATPVARGGGTSAGGGDGVCQRHNNVKEEPGWAFTVTGTGLPDPAGTGGPSPHTMTIRTPAGTAYESVAPPLLGWGTEPADDDRPPRPLMATENRRLQILQARLDRGEEFDDADWDQYGHLTWLAAG
jgi:hypothetical protein